ncbi:helix-turn-helix domain-containing protein [Chloroflexota bacterium]
MTNQQPTLKSIRENKLLSQHELAAQAGITVTTISRIETGKVSPSLKTIRALAKALDYEPLKLKHIFSGEIIEEVEHPVETEPEVEAANQSQSKLSGIAKLGRIWKRKT